MSQSMEKIAVVTGSNKGIGFAIVKELCAKFKGIVYLTSRDESRGNDAVRKLEKLGLHPKLHTLDINSDDSVNQFRKYLEDTHGGLDVLVNNSGIAYPVQATESFAEQARNTVGTNYFGTLRVCEALFPLLRSKARVVNVSSSCGHLSKINGKEPQAGELRKKLSSEDLTVKELSAMMNSFIKAANEGNHFELGWPNSTYNVSKVGVSALTRIQQRTFDLENRSILCNSVHPGYVNTDMSRGKGPLTIEEGAVAPVYLALLPPDVNEPHGAYIWRDTKAIEWTRDSLPEPV